MSNLRSQWAKIADRLTAGTAQAIEENAAELHELDSDEFFAECLYQGQAEES